MNDVSAERERDARNPYTRGLPARVAWDRGWRDQRTGVALVSNPYRQYIRNRTWSQGWKAARALARELAETGVR